MNVEIGTETPIILSWEYLFRICGILSLQCKLTGTSGILVISDAQNGHKTLWIIVINGFKYLHCNSLNLTEVNLHEDFFLRLSEASEVQ